ncbi:hypothetical protein LTR95_006965 [Oleoguttula sp. CCFEE 5521]
MAPSIAVLATALAALSTTVTASNVWTVNCAPLTIQRSDPILSLGTDSSHVHAAVGSSAFSRDMNGINGAADSTGTTCDKFTDHSSYWSPALYQITDSGAFQLLEFTGMNAYYQNYTCSYNADAPGYCQGVRDAQAPPAGLRMIAGDSKRRSYDDDDLWQVAILMEAGNSGEVHGMPETLDGSRISGHARFPSCWDGVHLDSDDHRSHVSYPDPTLHGDTQGGMCPESHPHAMINIGAQFGFNLAGITDPSKLVWSNGDLSGYGFHADFYMGWTDRDALTASFSNCFDNNNCPWRSFGSPTGKDPNPQKLLPDTPPPFQNLGAFGPLPALPGNNPVTDVLRIRGRRAF